MSTWLAIDTATDTAGIALHDGAAVVAESNWTSRRRHTVELAPAIQHLLRQHGLSVDALAGVVVAIGPGSYTPLRIGLAVAKGLALGVGLPLVGVPTLDVLAVPLSPPIVAREVPLWSVLRAGRGRLVAARYPPDPDRWPDPTSLQVLTVEELLTVARPPAWVAGELSATVRERLTACGFTVLPPAAGVRRAGWLAEVGRVRPAVDPATLVPVYLRPAG